MVTITSTFTKIKSEINHDKYNQFLVWRWVIHIPSGSFFFFYFSKFNSWKIKYTAKIQLSNLTENTKGQDRPENLKVICFWSISALTIIFFLASKKIKPGNV